MSTSTIPAAIDALIAACKSSPAIGGNNVDVLDGPTVETDGAPLILYVGQTPDDEPSAEGDQSIRGTMVRQEEFRLACTAVARSDTGTIKTVRDQAFAIMAGVETVLRNDWTLGGVLEVAQILGGVKYRPSVVQATGVKALLVFHVTCRARL